MAMVRVLFLFQKGVLSVFYIENEPGLQKNRVKKKIRAIQ